MNDCSSLISVIVTTFNRENLLKETLHSILSQTYRNIELIVIDNYSEYDFFQLINSFQDKRIRGYQNKNNGIIAANRNFGIKKAIGEFIAFCDDDDLWHPDKLKKQMDAIIQNNAICLVYTLYQEINHEVILDRILPRKKRRYEGNNIFLKLLFSSVIPNSSVLLRKEIIECVGYFDENPKLKAVEDWDLWLRVSQKYQIGLVLEPLTFYRLNLNGISKVSLFKNIKRINYVLLKHYSAISPVAYILALTKYVLFHAIRNLKQYL